jgi:hypothetical protein
MLGNNLRATGSKISMNGTITKTEKGINRSRSLVVRRSCEIPINKISAERHRSKMGKPAHLPPLSSSETTTVQQLPSDLATDLDLLSQKFRSGPVMSRLLFNDSPCSGRKRSLRNRRTDDSRLFPTDFGRWRFRDFRRRGCRCGCARSGRGR